MTKILFLTLHRKQRSPGQRFRHEQYLTALEESGHSINYSNLLTEKQDKHFYGAGNTLPKIGIGIQSIFKRLANVFGAHRYDYIFIYRDAFFFGIFFEWLFKQSGAHLVFDFDDSIWLHDENANQSFFQRLKNPAKTGRIIGFCDTVVAGNEYLANYARQFNDRVVIIPTTIDMAEYQPMKVPKDDRVCIGWSGSFSTIKHFESAISALKTIKDKYQDRICFKLIGDSTFMHEDLGIQGLPWNAATEVEDLCQMDIGIMPLPNDDWSKGKCGLKALQYMALGIPAVISPVGMNNEVVQDGVNGFLADGEKEWVEKLSRLIEDAALRKKLGEAGRQTVIEKYSVEANKEKWLSVFQHV